MRIGIALSTLIIIALILVQPGQAEKDWFLTENVFFFSPYGGQVYENYKFGLSFMSMPPVVNPGQMVNLHIRWFTTDLPGDPIFYLNVFGDWNPSVELGQGSLYDSIPDPYMEVEDVISFTAPTYSGSFRLRWCCVGAFAPIDNFWGHEGGGLYDPGTSPFSEISFRVEDHWTGVPESEPPTPKEVELSQNYPNPFNPATTIEYQLQIPGYVDIQIFNLQGQLVETLVHSSKPPGLHSVAWKPQDGLSSGQYFYQVIIDGRPISVRKAILLK